MCVNQISHQCTLRSISVVLSSLIISHRVWSQEAIRTKSCRRTVQYRGLDNYNDSWSTFMKNTQNHGVFVIYRISNIRIVLFIESNIFKRLELERKFERWIRTSALSTFRTRIAHLPVYQKFTLNKCRFYFLEVCYPLRFYSI